MQVKCGELGVWECSGLVACSDAVALYCPVFSM